MYINIYLCVCIYIYSFFIFFLFLPSFLLQGCMASFCVNPRCVRKNGETAQLGCNQMQSALI